MVEWRAKVSKWSGGRSATHVVCLSATLCSTRYSITSVHIVVSRRMQRNMGMLVRRSPTKPAPTLITKRMESGAALAESGEGAGRGARVARVNSWAEARAASVAFPRHP